MWVPPLIGIGWECSWAGRPYTLKTVEDMKPRTLLSRGARRLTSRAWSTCLDKHSTPSLHTPDAGFNAPLD